MRDIVDVVLQQASKLDVAPLSVASSSPRRISSSLSSSAFGLPSLPETAACVPVSLTSAPSFPATLAALPPIFLEQDQDESGCGIAIKSTTNTGTTSTPVELPVDNSLCLVRKRSLSRAISSVGLDAMACREHGNSNKFKDDKAKSTPDRKDVKIKKSRESSRNKMSGRNRSFQGQPRELKMLSSKRNNSMGDIAKVREMSGTNNNKDTKNLIAYETQGSTPIASPKPAIPMDLPMIDVDLRRSSSTEFVIRNKRTAETQRRRKKAGSSVSKETNSEPTVIDLWLPSPSPKTKDPKAHDSNGSFSENAHLHPVIAVKLDESFTDNLLATVKAKRHIMQKIKKKIHGSLYESSPYSSTLQGSEVTPKKTPPSALISSSKDVPAMRPRRSVSKKDLIASDHGAASGSRRTPSRKELLRALQ